MREFLRGRSRYVPASGSESSIHYSGDGASATPLVGSGSFIGISSMPTTDLSAAHPIVPDALCREANGVVLTANSVDTQTDEGGDFYGATGESSISFYGWFQPTAEGPLGAIQNGEASDDTIINVELAGGEISNTWDTVIFGRDSVTTTGMGIALDDIFFVLVSVSAETINSLDQFRNAHAITVYNHTQGYTRTETFGNQQEGSLHISQPSNFFFYVARDKSTTTYRGLYADIGFAQGGYGAEFVRQVVAQALTSWGEEGLVGTDGHHHQCRFRVRVREDCAAEWIDLSDFYLGCDFAEEDASGISTATVKFAAEVYGRKISPLISNSRSSLLLPKRQIRIERLLCPQTLRVDDDSMLWTYAWSGFIEYPDFGAGTISVKCSDNASVLRDMQMTHSIYFRDTTGPAIAAVGDPPDESYHYNRSKAGGWNLRDVLQELVDVAFIQLNVAVSDGTAPLYAPDPPVVPITCERFTIWDPDNFGGAAGIDAPFYTERDVTVLAELQRVASGIGLEVRAVYDYDSGKVRLKIGRQGYTSDASAHTFVERDVHSLRLTPAAADLRGKASVYFGDASGSSPNGLGQEFRDLPPEVRPDFTDLGLDASFLERVRTFGLNQVVVREDSATSTIQSATQAQAIATQIYQQTGKIPQTGEIENPYFPHIELGDVVTIQGSGLQIDADHSFDARITSVAVTDSTSSKRSRFRFREMLDGLEPDVIPGVGHYRWRFDENFNFVGPDWDTLDENDGVPLDMKSGALAASTFTDQFGNLGVLNAQRTSNTFGIPGLPDSFSDPAGEWTVIFRQRVGAGTVQTWVWSGTGTTVDYAYKEGVSQATSSIVNLGAIDGPANEIVVSTSIFLHSVEMIQPRLDVAASDGASNTVDGYDF